MLADVSHLSPRGFRDVVELAGRAGKPVMASHSNARALWDHTRNLQDGEFTAIASTGGVAGVNLYAGFLGESPTMDTVCAHIEHFLALDGADTHIALGGDWDGCDELPGDMQDGIAALPRLYERLLQRNHRESTLQNIFYQNLMRVVNDVCTM
jgi:membrane dipeptidase